MLVENRNSCAFCEVLLSLELCQSVTCRGALFFREFKILRDFGVFFGVGFELLRMLPAQALCFMRILFFHVFFQ